MLDVTISLRTCKLTKSLLKQIPIVDYGTFRAEAFEDVLSDLGEPASTKRVERPGAILGWVHGSVFGDDFKPWLLYKDTNNEYKRVALTQSSAKRHGSQLYIV